MTFGDYVPIVLGRTPPWVWAVLLLLIVLGARRLKPRRTHLAFAALAPLVFTVWSLAGAVAATRIGPAAAVAGAWIGAFLLGAASVGVHRGPRPAPLGGGAFLFPATATPLILYMLIFWTRYALGVWTAFEPELAFRLALAAIVISASTAGRFVADFAPLLAQWAARPEPVRP